MDTIYDNILSLVISTLRWDDPLEINKRNDCIYVRWNGECYCCWLKQYWTKVLRRRNDALWKCRPKSIFEIPKVKWRIWPFIHLECNFNWKCSESYIHPRRCWYFVSKLVKTSKFCDFLVRFNGTFRHK